MGLNFYISGVACIIFENFSLFQWNLSKDKWKMLSEKGKLDESLIDNLWKDVLDEKPLLLELMKKFDLICECLPVDMEVSLV
jgi:hypothetical protein